MLQVTHLHINTNNAQRSTHQGTIVIIYDAQCQKGHTTCALQEGPRHATPCHATPLCRPSLCQKRASAGAASQCLHMHHTISWGHVTVPTAMSLHKHNELPTRLHATGPCGNYQPQGSSRIRLGISQPPWHPCLVVEPTLCQKRAYSRCSTACSAPPTYRSTGIQYCSFCLSTSAAPLLGSMNRK